MKEIDKIISKLDVKLANENAMVSNMIEKLSKLNFSYSKKDQECSITKKHRKKFCLST